MHTSVEDISACSYNNQHEYGAKCHENSVEEEEVMGAVGHGRKGRLHRA